ncbi:RICIN domain-containing protein [Myceligenerans pegani]|uniref:RICIN domain-containing protein n=1 Tax=Myceligenerans pegani TaxID=2776917 RepID=A0ABR9N5V4_9MICO|nr:RICIN domain-containing protein [Myceligenerans sp. TRM 65318]MBE1879034.1 RICIN domain-containing protein [Myceligenerans sp. TRM 65318]MBE3021305.1 RICIN domain-containing protein [Myceligenerans sp. TRM 65318]
MRRAVAPLAIAAVGLALAPGQAAVAADETVSVDFAVSGGSPQHLASGTIYGMTEDGTLPQDHFYTDIGWNYMRAGGAQLDNPGGWIGGTYERRWTATREQAERTAQLGGTFVILVHDLWGADGEARAAVFPGDDGDWSSFDAFLDRLIADVRTSGVEVQWDIWNEPDASLFWNRTQAQYLQMWSRAHDRIRAAVPGAVIVGPSTARPPSASNTWWTTYLDHARATGDTPDIYSWHVLPGDPVATSQAADALLAERSLPRTTRYQINEYASPSEQTPADGAWYIARFERAGAVGLRANWGAGAALNDYLAKLLVKTGSQYLPTGEWWMYKYYGSMTGNIVSTTPSPAYDAFATKSAGKAQILLGGGGTTGNMAINLNNLHATSDIASGNQVRVLVQRVPYNAGGAVQGPETISDTVVTLNNNATTVNIPRTNYDDGYTITVLPPGDASFTSVAVAQHSGLCLDNTDLSRTDGNVQQQYHCEGGDQQIWRFTPVSGVADTYTVTNAQSGKCLDVSQVSTSDGAAVHQWTCISGAHNQQFQLRKVTYSGNAAQDYQLVARHSGKCVDVSEISTAPRAAVHQWTCNPAGQSNPKNQTWRLLGR